MRAFCFSSHFMFPTCFPNCLTQSQGLPRLWTRYTELDVTAFRADALSFIPREGQDIVAHGLRTVEMSQPISLHIVIGSQL
jgi:hypothetical protein